MSNKESAQPTKLIFVTGGVISGVGKGIISASIGVILQSNGYHVTAIKIDPYVNVDAGTISPLEHGEVFVLDDGGEVDMDLGNYERFLDLRLSRDNNITTGKVFKQVIERERRGHYCGKRVRIVPHVSDAIVDWIKRVAVKPTDGSGQIPDVCIIELGGAIGDVELNPYFFAFEKLLMPVNRANCLNVHVSLIITSPLTGRPKTKPVQKGIRALKEHGIIPDLVVCRYEKPLEMEFKKKISETCFLELEQILEVVDVPNIHQVPVILHEQNLSQILINCLKLPPKSICNETLCGWINLSEMCKTVQEKVEIALVGKYVRLPDSYVSVRHALQHAAMHAKRLLVIQDVDSEWLQDDTEPDRHESAWKAVKNADGILVPGGFGERGMEGMIAVSTYARTHNVPFLGICAGMQCAVIEFARNVCKINGAGSVEFNESLSQDKKVVINMPESDALKFGVGATMRLGLRQTVFLTRKCKLRQLYGQDHIAERHRHRYEINPMFVPLLCHHGLLFVGMSVESEVHFESLRKPFDADPGMCSTVEESKTNSFETGPEVANDEEDQELLEKVNFICSRRASGANADAIRMETFELKRHPFYVGVQCHPEFLSHPLRPNPLYLGFIRASSSIPAS